jgi:hypothetical protein
VIGSAGSTQRSGVPVRRVDDAQIARIAGI